MGGRRVATMFFSVIFDISGREIEEITGCSVERAAESCDRKHLAVFSKFIRFMDREIATRNLKVRTSERSVEEPIGNEPSGSEQVSPRKTGEREQPVVEAK